VDLWFVMFDFKLAWNKMCFYSVVKHFIFRLLDVINFELQICMACECNIQFLTLGSHVTGQSVGQPYLLHNFGPVLVPV